MPKIKILNDRPDLNDSELKSNINKCIWKALFQHLSG